MNYSNIVNRFAAAMINILIENEVKKGKKGWNNLSNTHLLKRIKEETNEIEEALLNNVSPNEVIRECVDVANFCMMLADNIEKRTKLDNSGKLKL